MMRMHKEESEGSQSRRSREEMLGNLQQELWEEQVELLQGDSDCNQMVEPSIESYLNDPYLEHGAFEIEKPLNKKIAGDEALGDMSFHQYNLEIDVINEEKSPTQVREFPVEQPVRRV